MKMHFCVRLGTFLGHGGHDPAFLTMNSSGSIKKPHGFKMKPNMKTRNTKFALGTLNLKSTPKLTKQSVSLTTHFYSDLKATRKVWVDLQEAFCVNGYQRTHLSGLENKP